MRILLATLAVAALFLVAVAALVVMNLDALIGAHRDELVARVERAVGRPVTVDAVVASWWPLGIRLRGLVVQDAPEFGDAPFLAADGVVITVRPWPLASGRIEAAGVVLDAPRVRLARAGGGRWNVTSLGSPEGPEAEPGRGKEKRRAARVPIEWIVGVALGDVYDGTLTIDDRRGGPRPPLVLRHVRLHAEDIRFGATATIQVDAALFATSGTDVHLDLHAAEIGQHDLGDTPFTARLAFADVDLAAASAALGREKLLAGRLRDLTVDAAGTPDRLRSDVSLQADDPELRVSRLKLRDLGALALTTRVVRDRDRLALEDMHATIGAVGMHGRGDIALTPWRVTLALDAESGGTAVLGDPKAPVRVRALGGHVAVDRNGVALEPLTAQLNEVPIEVRGWVTGVAAPAFDVHVSAQPFGGLLSADVALEPSGSVRARLDASEVDLEPAIAQLAPGLGARLAGRAGGAATLTGRVADGVVIGGSLAGTGTLTIERGRLYDVNVPDLVVDQIERLPFMPELVSAGTRKRYAELFASRDTVIDSARIPFTVGRGRLTTEDAAVVNPAYQIAAAGWIDRTHELRVHGDVVLGASVSRALRDDVHAAKYFTIDDGRVSLPFVARGRSGRFWVEPDAKRLRRRGLTALLGDSFGKDGDGNAGAPGKRRDEEPIEDKLIERLERMIHP